MLPLVACFAAPVGAQQIRMKDGRVLTGKVTWTAGVAETPDPNDLQPGQPLARPILLVDDELRRIYVPRSQIAAVDDKAPETLVTIKPPQNPAHGSARLGSVGPSLGITSFDEFGRRIYEMQGVDGPMAIVQGITELTPRYAKVESLLGPERTITWDMRIATTSIPSDMLAKIMARAVAQNDSQQRLQVVRFYIQGKRFHEARDELKRIIEEFPELKDLDNELAQLRRMAADVLLQELQLRRKACQHALVKALLASFPTDDTAGETLVEIRQLIGQYEQADRRIERIGQTLQQTIDAIGDPENRGLAAPIAAEIIRELSYNNVARLAPFVQLVDDSSLSAEEKSALAISGWLAGADQADRDLALAISLVKVRDVVRRYLTEPLASERQTLVNSNLSLEGVTVERLARLIAHMKPPWHDAAETSRPGGFLELAAPGQTEDGDFRYLVQLPPEYDPYRRYPTILALNGAYNSPEQELDFWAGAPPAPPPRAADSPTDGGKAVDNGPPPRRGHAMRHGYITIAVEWQKPHQYEYEFTGREHVAALTCLRDATRRFSLDTDRVFVTGHDIGGEAAWDLAQSHPDLWAGAIPITARADKYLVHYWKNAQYVPMCYVAGQLDGRSVAENAPVWDKQLRTAAYGSASEPGPARGFDITVVEFQGRGHEPFHDQILQLFDWMGRKSRGAPPKAFECQTLRPWDNFFWWQECQEFPEQLMMHPTDWSGRRARPARVEGKVLADNRLMVKTAATQMTIWLSPEIVDFSKPVKLTVNGRTLAMPQAGGQPDALVLLEDVRTRSDRQRPFWAKVDWP